MKILKKVGVVKMTIKRPLKIRTKIIIAYSIVLILSSVLTFFVFSLINNYILQTELEKVSLQTLTAMDKSIEGMFGQIKEMSNLIFFDSNMQKSLNAITSQDIDSKSQVSITKSITNMLLAEEYISSVYLFDKYNNYYHSYRSGDYSINIKDLKEASWYKEAEALKGDPLVVADSGGVLKKRNRQDKFISVVRNIMSLDTYQKIGTVIVNIDEKKLQDYFLDVSEKYDSQFFIVDANNHYIVRPTQYTKVMSKYLSERDVKTKGYSITHLNGKKYIVAQIKSTLKNWKLISITPIDANNLTNSMRNILYFPIVIINFIFIFICAIYLTKLIFKPLNSLQHYMQLVEEGEFVNIPIITNKDDEIVRLKRGFNKMVLAIGQLIEKIKIEQKIIRKNELDLIQAQVNPHFLYNTLDAASALNLIGDNEGAYKVVQELGNFYRNSLGNGRKMVTIKEELECIKSYIAILNIRYDNKIDLQFEVEEEILELSILKLLLQPIVENAVYHGIRYKHGQGTIKIQGYRDEDEVILIVTDDGKGMNQEKIEEILEVQTGKSKRGFGVYSAMQRIAIFYNIEKPITIMSEPECGTEITIRVKVMEGA